MTLLVEQRLVKNVFFSIFKHIGWMFSEYNRAAKYERFVDFKKVSDVYQSYITAIKGESRRFFEETGVEIMSRTLDDSIIPAFITKQYDYFSWRALLELREHYLSKSDAIPELEQDDGIHRVCFEYAFALWSYYASKGYFYEIDGLIRDNNIVPCIREIDGLGAINRTFKYKELYPVAEKIRERIDNGEINEDIFR